MKYGEDEELEAMADEIIRQSLIGITAHYLKKDILTISKQRYRWSREVLPKQGHPEKHERLGMNGRVRNIGRPDLCSRDGLASETRHRVNVPTAWDFAATVIPPEFRYSTITLEYYKRTQDGE